MERAAVIRLITETVDGYRLAMHGPGAPIDPGTRLFGPSGVLDSLGLVSVLVEIEQRVADSGAGKISLMDDRAMSRTRTPFATVDSLADYLLDRLAAANP